MSSVVVTDKRGGVFQVEMTFTYGECDRLPYNSMRKVKARIEQVPNGGIKATAEFNLRNAKDAGHFVEVLDQFGEDGSFVHGSSADPEVLNLDEPPEGGEIPGIRSATVVNASFARAAFAKTVPSPEKISADSVPEVPAEADDLEVEDEAELETEEEADVEAEEDAEMEIDEQSKSKKK